MGQTPADQAAATEPECAPHGMDMCMDTCMVMRIDMPADPTAAASRSVVHVQCEYTCVQAVFRHQAMFRHAPHMGGPDSCL